MTALPISVGSMLTATTSTVAAETLGEALAAQVEGDVADLLVDADRLGDARLLHLLAAALAGLVLGLADMDRDAQLLAHVGAGVHRDHRDARGDRVADRIAERLGVRDRDHEAVGLRGHRGVDQLRHLHHVEGVGRPVLDVDAEVLGRLSTPFLTTDQNGSEAWPWLTTTMRMSWASAVPARPIPAATTAAFTRWAFTTPYSLSEFVLAQGLAPNWAAANWQFGRRRGHPRAL